LLFIPGEYAGLLHGFAIAIARRLGARIAGGIFTKALTSERPMKIVFKVKGRRRPQPGVIADWGDNAGDSGAPAPTARELRRDRRPLISFHLVAVKERPCRCSSCLDSAMRITMVRSASLFVLVNEAIQKAYPRRPPRSISSHRFTGR